MKISVRNIEDALALFSVPIPLCDTRTAEEKFAAARIEQKERAAARRKRQRLARRERDKLTKD